MDGRQAPPSTKDKVLLSWSSGKDSAWALDVLRRDGGVEVAGLSTTVNVEYERVAMHGVREELLEAQARAVHLPLWKVSIPAPCSNEQYEARTLAALEAARARGVTAVAFGDLFLEDVRAYRERLMERAGLTPLFPLWGLDTRALAEDMVASGVRAVLTCVDPAACPRELAGREYDERLLRDLPAGVDPCGERGEFHTFAYAGPAFREAVPVEPGPVVERGGFVFADLFPQGGRG